MIEQARNDKKTPAKEKSKKRLVLLDAHAILHRAYHALPGFSSHKGEPTGALYGLAAMLLKLITDLKPDYLMACYDMPGPTFRHEAYEAYKAKRPKAEDDLVHQMNRSRDIFRAFSIPIYEKAGFEADDIIGTAVEHMKKGLEKGEVEIIIASGDMDTLQLVEDKKVQVYTLKKGINDTILYDEKAVKDRFGFAPKLLPDFKGLKGDPSDNILGIQGIGDKGATELIQNFGTIEAMYKKLKKDSDAFEKKGIKKRTVRLLEENEEEALFSKTLASIRVDVPVDVSLPEKVWRKSFDMGKVEALFRELNFRTLIERAKKLFSPGDEKSFSNGNRNDSHLTRLGTNNDNAAPGDEDVMKTGIALWLVDSNITNPKLDDILAYAGTTSFAKARGIIFKKLKECGLEKVYGDIELPLIPILKDVHTRGILIDKAHLKKLREKYHKELDALQKEIWKEAGVEFNINSPKQLGEVLFDKIGLWQKGLKKTEGGARSTRESELAKLKGAHPVIGHILGYRELQKLLSTYVDNMPHMAGDDGRLHTTFVQTGTTTGRMSSVNPNLQNIPVKGEYGAEIRKAFVASKGCVLAAFDYSQIELRALAILSGDKDLVRIFKSGRDVHGAVASEVFGVPESDVTKDMRRQAKVINFGIIYGMGVASLQKVLGTNRADAQKFYDNYFKEFPGVAEYLREIKKKAARAGYTETLFGRRRYFEGLTSHIPYIRAAAERMAVNAPVQGTATGDIIKLAIVKVDTMLRKQKLENDALLLLQVHDELVYEIKNEVVNKVVPQIEETMEHTVKTDVPLAVDALVGENWGLLERFKAFKKAP